MSKDNLSALAAASAFYALLSIFPTLTALVSLYGLVADPTMVERQVAAMEGILPPEAVKLVATWLQALVQGPTVRFGVGLLVSVLLASWSVWSATGMLMTAVNICYGDEEKRSFVRFNLEALALGAGLALFGVVALALVAVLPVLVDLLPAPGAWHAVISLVRWPILAGLAIVALAIVYRYARARVLGKWEWISWGAAIATALWLDRFDRLHLLCLRGRKLRQDIWIARRGDRPAALVLYERLCHPDRGGIECGDGTSGGQVRVSSAQTRRSPCALKRQSAPDQDPGDQRDSACRPVTRQAAANAQGPSLNSPMRDRSARSRERCCRRPVRDAHR